MEQTIACVACLISGIEIFRPEYYSPICDIRVVKGLHGLHLYSNEYWIDYALAVFRPGSLLNQSPKLTSLLGDLSQRFQLLAVIYSEADADETSWTKDSLALMEPYKGIYDHVRATLSMRAQRRPKIELNMTGGWVLYLLVEFYLT